MLRTIVVGVASLSVAGLSAALSAENKPAAGQGVQITELTNRLRVEVNGQLFTEYYFKDVPRPYCYPLIGPGGARMTRDWPMAVTPNEEHDHPHHRSLWFAHGAINGQDFWSEAGSAPGIGGEPGIPPPLPPPTTSPAPIKRQEFRSEAKGLGKTVHDGFLEVKSGADFGLIKSRNNWVAADGTVVCRDERALRIFNPQNPHERLLDFEITLFGDGPITFGDTKEGTMGLRLAETMRLKGAVGHGHIVNSEGVRDDATWGKRADWCDYYGPVNDQTVGVAIFDHPQNPRHPTWWHVRDYGLFAANPFGRHDFEKLRDKTAGDLVVPAGQRVTFRYRFYLHEGDEKQAKVAEKYAEYVKDYAQP